MNYYQSEKEAYVVPRAIVFDVKVEEGFASSGEGEITPGEEDSEWGQLIFPHGTARKNRI